MSGLQQLQTESCRPIKRLKDKKKIPGWYLYFGYGVGFIDYFYMSCVIVLTVLMKRIV
jgi:hypothetical protein